MQCPRCGKENRASRTVCVSCGHQLQYDISTGSEGSNPQSHAIEGNRCGNCGRYVPGGARFCTACGQPADGNTVCLECHSRIGPMDRYCPGCGRALRPEKAPRFTSRPVAAMMLGLVPGLLSLWGVGHLFAGRLERGIAFLVLGLVMNYVAPLSHPPVPVRLGRPEHMVGPGVPVRARGRGVDSAMAVPVHRRVPRGGRGLEGNGRAHSAIFSLTSFMTFSGSL